jgi:hypothetical protein
VAPVLANNATAVFPAANRSAMTPEPMTVAASKSEPSASANTRRMSYASLLDCVLPIAPSRSFSFILSSEAIGKLVNSLIRFSSA